MIVGLIGLLLAAVLICAALYVGRTGESATVIHEIARSVLPEEDS